MEAVAAKGTGDSDAQPREFWVNIDATAPLESIKLSMNYFACTDKLCLPLSQEYTIRFEKLGVGGWTYGFSPNRSRDSTSGGRSSGKEGASSRGSRMVQMDADKDGAVSFDEMSAMMKKRRGAEVDEAQMRRRFDQMDVDKDGRLSSEELEKMLQRGSR